MGKRRKVWAHRHAPAVGAWRSAKLTRMLRQGVALRCPNRERAEQVADAARERGVEGVTLRRAGRLAGQSRRGGATSWLVVAEARERRPCRLCGREVAHRESQRAGVPSNREAYRHKCRHGNWCRAGERLTRRYHANACCPDGAAGRKPREEDGR